MSLHPAMARSIDVLRARTGALLDRAWDEATERIARFSGRGAVWVEDAGREIGDSAVTAATQLTDAAGAHAERVADRFAGAVARWSTELSDRIVRFGAEPTGSRRERD